MAGTRKNINKYSHASTQLTDVTVTIDGVDYLAVLLKDQIVWDTITYTSNALSDVYVFNLSGVTQKTITLNYTGADKGTIQNVTKT